MIFSNRKEKYAKNVHQMKSSNTPKKEKDIGKEPSNSPPKREKINIHRKQHMYWLLSIANKCTKKGVFQRKRLVTQLVIVADIVGCQQKGYRVAENVVVMDICV